MVSVAETEAENQCKDLNLKKSVYAINRTQDRNLQMQALSQLHFCPNLKFYLSLSFPPWPVFVALRKFN